MNAIDQPDSPALLIYDHLTQISERLMQADTVDAAGQTTARGFEVLADL